MTIHFSCNFVLIAISWITFASSKSSLKTLESLSPVKEFNILKPDEDNGQEKISAAFKASINSPDTLGTIHTLRNHILGFFDPPSPMKKILGYRIMQEKLASCLLLLGFFLN